MSIGKFTLGELCTIEKGKTGILKAIPGEYSLVVTGEERKSHNEFQFDVDAVIIPLVSGTGHGHASIKRIHFQTGKFALGSILCAVIPKDKSKLNAEYLYYFLDLNRENELVARMRGMANVTLPMKEIAKVEIPLPNLDDQIEFVKMYKLLGEKSDDLSLEFDYQLNLVKKIRQQLLQDAVQGKLVEQESDDEPANALLQRIEAERYPLLKDRKLNREKELPQIKLEEIPFEIPENWVWCKIDQFVNSLKDDIRTGPFGTSLQKSEHKKDGIPVWGIENISKSGNFIAKNKIFVDENKSKELKSFSVKGGDLIISRSGTVGELCMLPENIPYGFISTNLMKISLNSEIILPEFFTHVMKGGVFIHKMLTDFCSGSTRLFITQKILNKLMFPLPPLSEQRRIIQKLKQLMLSCDALEVSIKQSQRQNEQLLQQVLRETLTKEVEPEATI
ncbi:restriction endonuclease subunit S [Mucilaginibacter sp. 10I4]|uniref:restriction endonuclease subunit S n=1 Tax=Mucilaginibacter sp. 10I4 TaxID=3048580 RepID=UPI002B222EDA|nr:restriction endonuclease subunit S [Mucilaginibacter sp. 10I4]MEB0260511.1 restriction endonuclease subunit S [Mucilaginibacter sp. 10I4]